ncbi:MAG: hypothetical protein NVS9B4_00850 [Candidatus Acidiferrum sp.]
MARQIIILENHTPGAGPTEPQIYKYLFWLNVPVGRQPYFANAAATSAANKGPNAATAAELLAIQNGAVKEVIETINVAPGTSIAQIQAILTSALTAAQSALSSPSANPWVHYGSSHDGSIWTINTVA